MRNDGKYYSERMDFFFKTMTIGGGWNAYTSVNTTAAKNIYIYYINKKINLQTKAYAVYMDLFRWLRNIIKYK